MDGTCKSGAAVGDLRAPGGFVYWSLLLMGFAAFAPAILLPEWRTYEALLVRERWERERMQRLENAVAREQQLMDGLRGDPAVIARVAQRELGFRRMDDQWINVQPTDPAGSAMLAAQSPLITNPDAPLEAWEMEEEHLESASIHGIAAMPPFVESVVAGLPPFPYDLVFAQEPTRSIMICLGMAAIGAAILLFGRRPYQVPEA